MLFTSESVSAGHPDKIADQISDAILDEALRQDPMARVAVECLLKDGLVVLAGEMSTEAWVDAKEVAQRVIQGIGYHDAKMGLDYRACGIISIITQQSADIARGIQASNQHDLGAGDQGMMFGFACKETEEYMPAPIVWAHRLMRQHHRLRQTQPDIWPDAKAQVSCEYNAHGQVLRISDIVLSSQHSPEISLSELRHCLQTAVIEAVIPEALLQDTRLHLNPAGQFVLGGPFADCGLTGRKLMVDTYGGRARHGGGCFSGKDASKVDRSAAYMARYVAKHIVAAGLADACELQVAYAIGQADPVALAVHLLGERCVDEAALLEVLPRCFDFTPAGIIDTLSLRQAVYQPTACFGHFGPEKYAWEKLDARILAVLNQLVV